MPPEQGSVYIEPQLQLTYSYQGSTTVQSSNGLLTHLSDFESILGRASVIVGYNAYTREATQFDIYLKRVI